MKDLFSNQGSSLTSPFSYAEPVVPNDTADLAYVTRSLYVGAAGNIRVTTVGGTVVTFVNHPVGYLPARIARVHATGTTASAIVAIW